MTINQATNRVKSLGDKLDQELKVLKREAERLVKLGVIYGKLKTKQVRGTTYTYLHDDPKRGEREPNGRARRRCLGRFADNRIKDAQAAIARGRKLDDIKIQIRQTEEALQHIKTQLAEVTAQAVAIRNGQYWLARY